MRKNKAAPVQYEKVWIDEKKRIVSFHDVNGYELHLFETHDELICYVLQFVTHGYSIL